MSTDFTLPFHSYLSDVNDYTNKIQDVFNQHWITLNDQRQKLTDKIDQWCDNQKEFIDEYANKQKLRINDYYNRLRPIFDKEHTENLAKANAYYAARQVDLFDELQKACQSLKFSLATLQSSKYEFEFPEITIVDPYQESKTPEEINIARRRRRQNIVNDNNIRNTTGTIVNSSSNAITSIAKQINNQQSSKINSKKKNAQSTDNTDDSKNEILNEDQSDNKCPICFMIFPLNMTTENRQRHVNEHYIDD